MRDTIEAVAFDIDGTLYPNWRLYIRIVPFFLKNLAFFLKYRKVRDVLHRTAPLPDFYEYQARLLAEQMKISVESARTLIDTTVYDGLRCYFPKIKPYAHVEETFKRFKDSGLKIGILSDFPPEQKGDLWGLLPYCDVVMGSEACGALKPSAFPFGLLAKNLDVAPQKILYVGNSISADIEGANKFGLKSAYILPFWRKILNRPHPKAHISFKNYRQLQQIVLE